MRSNEYIYTCKSPHHSSWYAFVCMFVCVCAWCISVKCMMPSQVHFISVGQWNGCDTASCEAIHPESHACDYIFTQKIRKCASVGACECVFTDNDSLGRFYTEHVAWPCECTYTLPYIIMTASRCARADMSMRAWLYVCEWVGSTKSIWEKCRWNRCTEELAGTRGKNSPEQPRRLQWKRECSVTGEPHSVEKRSH